MDHFLKDKILKGKKFEAVLKKWGKKFEAILAPKAPKPRKGKGNFAKGIQKNAAIS